MEWKENRTIFMIRQKGRLVIEYRQINKNLLSEKFPLPRIDDSLDQLYFHA